MAKRYLLGGTGMSGNGKSTLLDLTAIALGMKHSGGRIVRAEMGKIILWGSRLHGPLGRQVCEQQRAMDNGAYLADDTVIPLFETWLEAACQSHPEAETFLIGGMPRTERQRRNMLALFDRSLVVNIAIATEIALQRIIERLKRSGDLPARRDDAGGIPVFENRLDQFKRHTAPMLSGLNGDLINLNHEEKLATQLETTIARIRKMDQPIVSRGLAKKALGRVRSTADPIHREIRKVLDGQGITPGMVPHLQL